MAVSVKAPGAFGTHDSLRHGLASAKSDILPKHPLYYSEKNYSNMRDAMFLQVSRNTQGLHVPLRLQMERRLVSQVQRIPPLESSFIALDTLMGTHETIGVEDVFINHTPVMVDGRAIMEERLNLRL